MGGGKGKKNVNAKRTTSFYNMLKYEKEQLKTNSTAFS